MATQPIYISQATKILGIDLRTFRKYVKKGIIKPAGKDALGRNTYDSEQIKKLIKKMNRKKGLAVFSS